MKDGLSSPLLIRYQKAYEDDPNSLVFAPLAEAYRKLGMLDKSQEILVQGLKKHPDYLLGHLGLARCYYDLNQHQQVCDTLMPYISGHRDNLQLQKLYAESSYKLGNFDEALETYKHVLFINPKDKAVGDFVLELEAKIEAKASSINQVKSTTTFEIEKIPARPVDEDFDDWRQEDFSITEKLKNEGQDSWSMTKISEDDPADLELPLDIEPEEERVYVINQEDIKIQGHGPSQAGKRARGYPYLGRYILFAGSF